MTDPYDPAFGYSYEELRILQAHDQGETLHEFVGCGSGECFCGFDHPEGEGLCIQCDDDSSGLMHNNTWRNVEPLIDLDACVNGCVCYDREQGE